MFTRRSLDAVAPEFYNVHRWLKPATGRYVRPDPPPLARALESYVFGRQAK